MSDLQKDILGFNFRQKLVFEDGFETTGYILDSDWKEIGIPEDLSGKSFLDVGANDGLYSFRAEKNGASRIVATDLYDDLESGSSAGTGWPIGGIKMAKEYANSKIEIESKNIFNLSELNEEFDFVFCSNVIAWLTDIPGAIKELSKVTRETLIIRDGLWEDFDKEPAVRYEVGKPFIYRPNKKFMEAVLRENGYKQIEFVKIGTQYDVLPLYTIEKGVKTYTNYVGEELKGKIEKSGNYIVTTSKGERSFVKHLGWVDQKDMQQFNYRIHPVKKMLKPIFGKETTEKMKNSIFGNKLDMTPYSIIAKK